MDTEVLKCVCHSADHCYIINFDEWDNEKTVYIEPHLSTGGFWHRLKYAFKYLFGWKCRYGCFDEIIISKDNYHPLKKIVQYLESEKIIEK